jgi:hypothetical protein
LRRVHDGHHREEKGDQSRSDPTFAGTDATGFDLEPPLRHHHATTTKEAGSDEGDQTTRFDAT